MDAHAPATPCRKPPASSHSLPPPPALLLVRARSRVSESDLSAVTGAGAAAFSGPPDTPPRLSPVTVPFLWEDAPGKPKDADPSAAAAKAAVPAAPETGDRQQDSDVQARRPLPPLKLPPRLQHVSSSSFAATAADTPVSSPKTVLDGPYHGCVGGGRRKPPRWARCGGGGVGAAAAFRRTPSAGVGLFSRTWSHNKPKAPVSASDKNDHERDAAAGADAPWCSPASSSSTSSSSVSTCFGGDDNGRGRAADGREVCSEQEEEDGGEGSARGLVRITRFRRNRSLPSMATSNLWASIRRSVKQITPWS